MAFLILKCHQKLNFKSHQETRRTSAMRCGDFLKRYCVLLLSFSQLGSTWYAIVQVIRASYQSHENLASFSLNSARKNALNTTNEVNSFTLTSLWSVQQQVTVISRGPKGWQKPLCLATKQNRTGVRLHRRQNTWNLYSLDLQEQFYQERFL